MTTTRTWRGYVFIAATLDGYIARHGGDIEWLTDPRPTPTTPPAMPGRIARQACQLVVGDTHSEVAEIARSLSHITWRAAGSASVAGGHPA